MFYTWLSSQGFGPMQNRFHRLNGTGHMTRCLFLMLFCLLLPLITAAAQEKCLNPGRLEQIKKQLETASSEPANQKLKDEIIKAGTELGDINRRTLRERDEKPDPRYLAAAARIKTQV